VDNAGKKICKIDDERAMEDSREVAGNPDNASRIQFITSQVKNREQFTEKVALPVFSSGGDQAAI